MLSINRNIAIAFFGAVAVRLAFFAYAGFIADDAFITFRYAENLALGNGFVYNEGQPTLGTTTPLFTLALAALYLFGLPTLNGAILLSLICSGVTAVILFRFARSLRFGDFAMLPPLMYAFFPRSLAPDSCGMETAFFTMLITAAFYFQHKRRPYYAIGCATLSALTRPEGALLIVLLLALNAIKSPRRALRLAAVSAALLVPWIAFATFYFGSPVPNSVTAKLALYGQIGSASFGEKLVYLMAWHNPVGWAIFAGVVIGGYWLWRKQNFGRLEATWLILTIGAFAAGSVHLFFWYVAPIYPVYLLFTGASFMYARDKLRIRPVWVTLPALLVLSFGGYRAAASYKTMQTDLENVHKAIGIYVRANSNQTDLFAAEDIGYAAYYSKLQLLDRCGLVSPEAIPYVKAKAYRRLIMDFEPEWVMGCPEAGISDFFSDSVFLKQYRLVKIYKSSGNWTNHLYSKKTNP